jgi:hypothetical protein
MKISKDTEEVLRFLDYTSGNNLRKRNDLGIILELGASLGNDELVSKIIFNGSYLWNVFSALRKAGSESEEVQNLKNEFERIAIEITINLKELISTSEEDDIERFEKIYFADTTGSLRNLIDLAHDIAELKNLQNTMKYKDSHKK